MTGGGSGGKWATQFVANPWGIWDVWIQCTTKYVAGDGQSDFGIAEIEFFDATGRIQRTTYAGSGSVYGALVARLFVQRLVSVTVAVNTYDAAISGTTTLFQWG